MNSFTDRMGIEGCTASTALNLVSGVIPVKSRSGSYGSFLYRWALETWEATVCMRRV